MNEKTTDYVIDVRRYLHKYPELSNEEIKTSTFIQNELKKMGIDYELVGKTGVVATINKKQNGKTIALRADIDAIQVEEDTNLPFSSQNPGVMHACGHDGHTAILLGAAKELIKQKDKLNGSVKFLFQPAEELAQGANMLISNGVLKGVDRIFGIHLWSDCEYGKIFIDEGPKMAAVGILKIDIEGKGGHGSMPHQGVDAILTGSAIIQNLQSIVSREINPMDSLVLSIGKFNAGTRFNVIADKARLEGTTRTFDQNLLNSLEDKITRCVEGIASAYRAKVKVEHQWVTKIVNNDPCVTRDIKNVIVNTFGNKVLGSQKAVTAGEDMSFYLGEVPGAFAFVGSKVNEFPHHHPKFDINEGSLEIGTSLFVKIVEDYLK